MARIIRTSNPIAKSPSWPLPPGTGIYYRRISAVKQCKLLRNSQSNSPESLLATNRWPKSLRTLGTRLILSCMMHNPLKYTDFPRHTVSNVRLKTLSGIFQPRLNCTSAKNKPLFVPKCINLCFSYSLLYFSCLVDSCRLGGDKLKSKKLHCFSSKRKFQPGVCRLP